MNAVEAGFTGTTISCLGTITDNATGLQWFMLFPAINDTNMKLIRVRSDDSVEMISVPKIFSDSVFISTVEIY